MDEQNLEHRKMASVKLTRQWLEDAAANSSFWGPRVPLKPIERSGVQEDPSQERPDTQAAPEILEAVETPSESDSPSNVKAQVEVLGDPEFLPETADVSNTLQRIYEDVEERAKILRHSSQ